MEFKTFGKKAVSVGLSCALLASTSLTAFAAGTSDVTLQVKGNSDTEPPEIVNIRIPAEIPLTMDEEGVITVEDGLYIENLSDTTGVTVSGISVTGKNGWNVVDFDTDLSGEAENTQKLSMSFNGDGTKDGGAVTLTPDAWDIGKSEQLALTVGAKMPKQNEDSYATKASIATVNYSFSANSTTEPGGGEDPIPDKGQITNNWDSQKALLSTGAREVTFSWDSTDESASITEVKSEDEGVATVQKASTLSLTSMDYSGSENWTVTGVGKGKTTVTATLSSGETTQFDVEVYELPSGGTDTTVGSENTTGTDSLKPGDDLGDGSHNITVEIPISTPDGDDTITVTPEFPEDTVLEEGENNIEVDVVVDGVTLHITITINIKGSNPSDGLIQSVQEAQAMGFTFSSYEDGLQIDSFENKQFKSEVNVPEQIGDFKVLKIGNHVFKGQTNLKKITLPSTLEALGAGVFWGCSNAAIYFSDETTRIKHFRDFSKSSFVDDSYLGQLYLFKDVKSVHLSNLNILSDDALVQLIYSYDEWSLKIYVNGVEQSFTNDQITMKYTGNDAGFVYNRDTERVLAFGLSKSGELVDLSGCVVRLGNSYDNLSANIKTDGALKPQEVAKSNLYIATDSYSTHKIATKGNKYDIYLNNSLIKSVTLSSALQ